MRLRKDADMSMTRRELLQGVAAATAASVVLPLRSSAERPTPARKNFIFLITDQQGAGDLSVEGNQYVKTPALDRLASQATRFQNAYCTHPLCSPSRASLFTSQMPHDVGVNSNPGVIPANVPSMGKLFQAAGYETAYAGKWHLPAPYPALMAGKARGQIPHFRVLPMSGTMEKGDGRGLAMDGPATDAAVKFIESPHEKPYLLVVSLLNPHDICGFAQNPEHFKHGLGEIPPLLPNFNAIQNEPGMLERIRQNGETANWSDQRWREYRAIYYRLTEIVDRQVQRVLDALDKSGQAQNTVVLHTSDHGEMMGAHRLVHKLKLYQEATNVPLIVHVPGVTEKAAVNSTHLVSGLDVLPTLCDYAGIAPAAEFRGQSLRPLIEGRGRDMPARDFLVSEVGADHQARMVRSGKYKYVVYRTGTNPEQFFDLTADPGETKNLIADGTMKAAVDLHRAMLHDWIGKTKDPFTPPKSAQT